MTCRLPDPVTLGPRRSLMAIALVAASLGFAPLGGARAADTAPAPAADPSPAAQAPPAPEASPVAAAPAAVAPNDPRPLVRLIVSNAFRPEDKLFPQLVEGRLVSDLADMETFRTAAHDASHPDYTLTCVIRNITYDASTVYKTSRDADAPSTPQPSNLASLSMDITFTLEDSQGKLVHQGKLNADASREFEISFEHTSGLLKEEMIDRAAQRLERLVRKKIKSR